MFENQLKMEYGFSSLWFLLPYPQARFVCNGANPLVFLTETSRKSTCSQKIVKYEDDLKESAKKYGIKAKKWATNRKTRKLNLNRIKWSDTAPNKIPFDSIRFELNSKNIVRNAPFRTSFFLYFSLDSKTYVHRTCCKNTFGNFTACKCQMVFSYHQDSLSSLGFYTVNIVFSVCLRRCLAVCNSFRLW